MFPTPLLFWIVVGLVLIGAAATARLLQTHRDVTDASFHNGKLPGYSYTDGFNISLDASSVALPDGDWTPTRLETFHTSGRTRLILSVRVDGDDTDAVDALVDGIIEEMFDRTDAQVVLVQATNRAGRRWEQLRCRDGRGWWGAEAVRRAARSHKKSPAPDTKSGAGPSDISG